MLRILHPSLHRIGIERSPSHSRTSRRSHRPQRGSIRLFTDFIQFTASQLSLSLNVSGIHTRARTQMLGVHALTQAHALHTCECRPNAFYRFSISRQTNNSTDNARSRTRYCPLISSDIFRVNLMLFGSTRLWTQPRPHLIYYIFLLSFYFRRYLLLYNRISTIDRLSRLHEIVPLIEMSNSEMSVNFMYVFRGERRTTSFIVRSFGSSRCRLAARARSQPSMHMKKRENRYHAAHRRCVNESEYIRRAQARRCRCAQANEFKWQRRISSLVSRPPSR